MQVGYNDAEKLIRTELNYIQTRAAAKGVPDGGTLPFKDIPLKKLL